MEKKLTICQQLGIRFDDQTLEVIDIPDLSCTLEGTPRRTEHGKELMGWGTIAFGFTSKTSKKIIMVIGTKEDLQERFHSVIVNLQPDWVSQVEDLIEEDAEALAEDIKLAKESAKDDGEEFTDAVLAEVYNSHDWCDVAEVSDEVMALVKQKANDMLKEDEECDLERCNACEKDPSKCDEAKKLREQK